MKLGSVLAVGSNPDSLFSELSVVPVDSDSVSLGGSIWIGGVEQPMESVTVQLSGGAVKQFVHCYVGRRRDNGQLEWVLDELDEGQAPYTTLVDREHDLIWLLFSAVIPVGADMNDVELNIQTTVEAMSTRVVNPEEALDVPNEE